MQNLSSCVFVCCSLFFIYNSVIARVISTRTHIKYEDLKISNDDLIQKQRERKIKGKEERTLFDEDCIEEVLVDFVEVDERDRARLGLAKRESENDGKMKREKMITTVGFF